MWHHGVRVRRTTRHNAGVISEAARMRAGALVRRHRVATIVLALVAGLGAAVPMATWAAGRRTAVAVDQFIARADAPDLLLDFCPEGVEPRTADEMDVCTTYVPRSELGILRSMPQVRDAAQASWSVMRLATAADGPFRIATLIQVDGAGRPDVVRRAGRRQRPAARPRRPGRAARQRQRRVGARRRRRHSRVGERPRRTGRGRSRRPSSAWCEPSASWCRNDRPRRSHRATRCSTPARPGRRPTATTCCAAATRWVCDSSTMIRRRSSPRSASGCRVESSTSATPWTRR